jgi:hypothetical protein
VGRVQTFARLNFHDKINNKTIEYLPVISSLPDRVPYTSPTLEPERFCIFQSTPCKANACRVATNIIAILYPLNFSKFLIKSYHPLKEEERKKLVTIKNFDFKNFIQKFCDDINKTMENTINSERIHPLHFMDLLWESDDSESALLSDMASAFAECYLIDFQFPQRHVIYQYFTKFFLARGTDIEFDSQCFETISGSKIFNANSKSSITTSSSPLKRKMIDDKINDIQSKMDKLNINTLNVIVNETSLMVNCDENAVANAEPGEYIKL